MLQMPAVHLMSLHGSPLKRSQVLRLAKLVTRPTAAQKALWMAGSLSSRTSCARYSFCSCKHRPDCSAAS